MDRFFSKKKTDDVCVSVELGVAYMTRKHTHWGLGSAAPAPAAVVHATEKHIKVRTSKLTEKGTMGIPNGNELRAGDYRAARDKPEQLATIQFVLLIN